MDQNVDVVIEDERWETLDLAGLAERAFLAVCGQLGFAPDHAVLVVMGCDDARIAALNADFRGKPMPTNILSWPSDERAAAIPGQRPALPEHVPYDGELHLGDLAIAWETCLHEAQEQNKPHSDHVTHLLVHGMLHLFGYDHVDDEDAELMEETERQILARMGIADPYHVG